MALIHLVEDDHDVRQLMVTLLTRAGHRVKATCNGLEALCLLTEVEQLPDVLITDLIMPEKEGLELIRDVTGEFPLVKIIAISGGGRLDPGDYLETAKIFGARGTLYKPFQRRELLAEVDNVLAEC